jgi:VIT1/CCC1 family predicted Fe2+/Mn2+ transporter
MNIKNSVRFIAAGAIGVLTTVITHNYVSHPVNMALGFWTMCLILPLHLSSDDMNKKKRIIGQFIGATIGAIVVYVINRLF